MRQVCRENEQALDRGPNQRRDYGHREMTRSVQKALAVAGDHGKVAGMAVPSYELAEPWIKQGVRFFETMGDVGFIAQGSAELMKRFPGHGPGVAAG